MLVATSLYTAAPTVANADKQRTIEDESIYDVLVDRFFNGNGQNDFEVNTKNQDAFNGGDFDGLISKKAFIEQMGFTIVSLGNVFETLKYDGSLVTSFEQFEKHFGTAQEFEKLIDTYKKSNMKIMIDFPLNKLSVQHEWFVNGANKEWVAQQQGDIVTLDLQNLDLQRALQSSLQQFVKKYDVSIRLTNIDDAPEAFLNVLINTVKNEREHTYIIANGESAVKFDAKYDASMIDIQRNIFKTVDQSSDSIVAHKDSNPPTQVLIDSPWSDRFILYGEKEGMYPPTRAKMAVLSTLLIPGVPVVQYGTEIAVNGEAGSAAHQLYNFKTDTELIDQIKNIQMLRNSSETLRNGNFKVIRNENGYLAFTRTSKEEQWLVVINNTSRTENVVLTKEDIGEDKKITSLLERETIRSDKNGNYRVILDREMIEIYQIKDDTGINKSYLIALGLVYILFTWFVIVVLRRGKLRRAQQN
jgi:cyclomaltodextrinase / maltogenic alpha-amylase / neopullulanase